MARYKFTTKDLRQFRPLLDLPGAQILTQTTPIKRLDLKARHVADIGELPVTIKGKDAPNGVAIPAVAAALKEQAPFVETLVVRNGRAQVLTSKPLTTEERAQLVAILRTPAMKSRIAVQTARWEEQLAKKKEPPTKLEPPTRPTTLTRAEERELAALHDSQLSDKEWLAGFRKYATANLLPKVK
jgi:hypothetical protein